MKKFFKILTLVIVCCFFNYTLCFGDSNEKVIYLTFDDGPTVKSTPKILEILKKNNIKATFFVIGKEAEINPQIIKELCNNKMCIAAHTYSHKYNAIYKNPTSYFDDIEKCRESIKNILGKDSVPFIRMPCGSSNTFCSKQSMKTIKNGLIKRNLNYVDWNVTGEDSNGKNVPINKIRKNVFTQSKDKDFIVLLLHDGYYNGTTVELLPEIISYYKAKGFVFKTFDDISIEHKNIMIKRRIVNKGAIEKNTNKIK